MGRSMKTQKAGTILINKEKRQIGLVYRVTRKDLTFPKGHVEEGETIDLCAIRETEEETGHFCHLLSEEAFSTLSYTTPDQEEVEAHFFIALDDGKSNNISPDPEILVWIDIDDVDKSLSYDNLKILWEDAKEIVMKVLNE